jgi:hypothetical protein
MLHKTKILQFHVTQFAVFNAFLIPVQCLNTNMPKYKEHISKRYMLFIEGKKYKISEWKRKFS